MSSEDDEANGRDNEDEDEDEEPEEDTEDEYGACFERRQRRDKTPRLDSYLFFIDENGVLG